jgi:hypothetical protein
VNNTSSDDKIDLLIRTLLRLTRERQLAWEVGDPWRKFTYTVSLPGYSASIFSEDNDGLQPFHLHLLDSEGQPFETIVSERGYEGEWDGRSLKLQELYDAARRSALNTDAAIDGFLSELKKLEDPPF